MILRPICTLLHGIGKKIAFKYRPAANCISVSHNFSNNLLYVSAATSSNSGLLNILDINRKSHLQINTISFIEEDLYQNLKKRKGYNALGKGVNIKKMRYEKYVADCLENDFHIVHGWQTVIDKIEDKTVSRSFFETFLMKKCLEEKNLTIANSYMDYLKTIREKLNFVALSIYLQILAENIETEEKLFRDTYEELLQKEPLLRETRLSIICALSLAKCWDEAFHHLIILEKSCSVHQNDTKYLAEAFNIIIQTLARERGFDSAYEYVNLLENKCHSGTLDRPEKCLDQRTIITLLESMQRFTSEKSKHNQFTLILKLLQTFEVTVSRDLAESLSALLPRHWEINKIKITCRKPCSHCGAKLLPSLLNPTTFNKLRTECLEKVKGTDIFYTTTPKEWQKFLQYLNLQAPFDLVVDGLNIYYFMKTYDYFMKTYDKMADQLIFQLSQDYPNAKILFLARTHLMWIKKFQKLFPSIYFYFVEDVTKDDIFLLYAALLSGINCKILTRDYLRNHKFVLEDPILKKQFLTWQRMNQILVDWRRGRLIYKRPYEYQPIAQWNEDKQSWHLPLRLEEKVDYMDGSHEWLCVRKRTPDHSNKLKLW